MPPPVPMMVFRRVSSHQIRSEGGITFGGPALRKTNPMFGFCRRALQCRRDHKQERFVEKTTLPAPEADPVTQSPGIPQFS
jgi:hypothetical protein